MIIITRRTFASIEYSKVASAIVSIGGIVQAGISYRP